MAFIREPKGFGTPLSEWRQLEWEERSRRTITREREACCIVLGTVLLTPNDNQSNRTRVRARYSSLICTKVLNETFLQGPVECFLASGVDRLTSSGVLVPTLTSLTAAVSISRIGSLRFRYLHLFTALSDSLASPDHPGEISRP